jgi:hypothetical protein
MLALRLQILTAALLGAGLIPKAANSATITFNFTGAVTQVPIDDIGTGIQPLDAITGSFTFDSTAVDAITASTSGSYTSTGGAFGITVTIGSGALTFAESGSLNIGILNSFVDQYTLHASSSPSLVIDFLLQDNSGTAFSSDSLPLSPPPLAGFAQRDFHLDETDIAGNETQADGVITSLSCGSGCIAASAPEPASAVLVLTGIILYGGGRLTRSRVSKNRRKK